MITDALPTYGTVTEVDGDVVNDVQEERGVADSEHVSFFRIWGSDNQPTVVYSWEKNVVLKSYELYFTAKAYHIFSLTFLLLSSKVV